MQRSIEREIKHESCYEHGKARTESILRVFYKAAFYDGKSHVMAGEEHTHELIQWKRCRGCKRALTIDEWEVGGMPDGVVCCPYCLHWSRGKWISDRPCPEDHQPPLI